MSTRFKKTSLALALSAMLLPYHCAAAEPTEGVKAGLVTLEQDVSQRNHVPVNFIGSYQDNLVLQNAGVNVLHNALERQDKMAISHFDFKSNALTLDDESASSRLVIVDGNYVANLRQGTWEKVRAYLKAAALAGNPVIGIGDPSIVRELFPDQANDTLPEVGGPGEVTATTAYGYYQSPQGYARALFTNETDVVKLMEKAKSWAKDVLDEHDQTSFLQTAEKVANKVGWAPPAYQRNSLYNFKDYGAMHVKTAFIKVSSDGNSSYDWWQVHVQHLIHPSWIVFGNDYWRNADMYTMVQVNNKISGFLAEHSPTTSSGITTVGVNMSIAAGPTGPTSTIGVSWTYSASDVMIADQTYGNAARWYHDLNQDSWVGQNTYNAQPGLIARVPNGTTAIYNKFYEYYAGQWGHHRCGLRICGWDWTGQYWIKWNQ